MAFQGINLNDCTALQRCGFIHSGPLASALAAAEPGLQSSKRRRCAAGSACFHLAAALASSLRSRS
jgi:hypothetical protein